jgi:hypothetical protein
MRKTFITMTALAIALVAWAHLGAQQEMLPKPGPGSGVTPVSQKGDWAVAISNTPSVHIANPIQVRGPIFLRRGSYRVTWPNGETENVTIITMASDTQRAGDRMADRSPELITDGWVEVQSEGRRRWVNIMAARSIEEGR